MRRVITECLMVFQSTRPMRGATNDQTLAAIRKLFQSTRPMRGATKVGRHAYAPPKFQSTRPMRGATGMLPPILTPSGVSIHAPHAGRDPGICSTSVRRRRFNPRAPCGARRAACDSAHPYSDVSIHAPHAGRDRRVLRGSSRQRRFNPRAPCGARPQLLQPTTTPITFQSTRPMRGATLCGTRHGRIRYVSIHAPHAGRDPSPR